MSILDLIKGAAADIHLPRSPSTALSMLETRKYCPDALRRSAKQGIRTQLKSVWKIRDLIFALISRDISVTYRQSVLGAFWAVLPPLITTSVFAILARFRVLAMGELVLPYPVYVLWGLIHWQLFSTILRKSTSSLTDANALVKNINFPKESLLFASVGQPLVDYVVRLFPMAVVLFAYDITPSFSVALIPLLIIPLLLLALGLGFFLAIINMVSRDISNIVGMLLTFGIFAAPIVYPPPINFPFLLVNYLNPFSPFLISAHDLLTHGTLTRPLALVAAVIFSAIMFLLGWRFFNLSIQRALERI